MNAGIEIFVIASACEAIQTSPASLDRFAGASAG